MYTYRLRPPSSNTRASSTATNNFRRVWRRLDIESSRNITQISLLNCDCSNSAHLKCADEVFFDFFRLSGCSIKSLFYLCSPLGRIAQLVQSICLTSRGSAVRIRVRPHPKLHSKEWSFFHLEKFAKPCLSKFRAMEKSTGRAADKSFRGLYQ